MAKSKYPEPTFFKPRNPEKYKGDPSNIIARSSWESRVMVLFDDHPEIITWSSEEIVIPYFDTATGKYRRYFPDFVFTKKDGSTYLVEIKPYSQTIEPIKKKKQKNTTFLKEVMTYATNSSKWEAAKKYCKKRGWKFMIVTEREIFGK